MTECLYEKRGRKNTDIWRGKKVSRDDITYIFLWRRLALLCLHQQTFGSGFLIVGTICFHHVPFLCGDDMLLLAGFLPWGGTRWQITWRHWKVVGQQCQRWRDSTCAQRRDCWEERKEKKSSYQQHKGNTGITWVPSPPLFAVSVHCEERAFHCRWASAPRLYKGRH